MIKVNNQISVGGKTIVTLDSPLPAVRFKKVSVGGKEYEAEIVYGMENSLGVDGSGSFIGKEVKFN